MTLDEFRKSLTATEPPAKLTLALSGLWWDAKGDWTRAHESAQQDEGREGSWVHAYVEDSETHPKIGIALCRSKKRNDSKRKVSSLLSFSFSCEV
jgi:hypothetical protein